MEREWLTQRLKAGASIEAIAREAGRDPSTVSYWARKHGLTSAHAPRHAARGGIDRALLAEVVACELSVRDMAEVFDRSPTTIRHWLRRHAPRDLGTHAAARCRRGRRRRRPARAAARCQHHGMTRHVRRDDGFRCAGARRPRRGVASDDQARPRRGGRRRVRAVRLLPLRRRAAVPSRRSRGEALRAQPRGGHALARQGTGGGTKNACSCARTVMLRSRAGLCRASRKIGRRQPLSGVARHGQSGVAQWQSIRLLIEGLWVRVPPPELVSGITRGPPGGPLVRP